MKILSLKPESFLSGQLRNKVSCFFISLILLYSLIGNKNSCQISWKTRGLAQWDYPRSGSADL